MCLFWILCSFLPFPLLVYPDSRPLSYSQEKESVAVSPRLLAPKDCLPVSGRGRTNWTPVEASSECWMSLWQRLWIWAPGAGEGWRGWRACIKHPSVLGEPSLTPLSSGGTCSNRPAHTPSLPAGKPGVGEDSASLRTQTGQPSATSRRGQPLTLRPSLFLVLVCRDLLLICLCLRFTFSVICPSQGHGLFLSPLNVMKNCKCYLFLLMAFMFTGIGRMFNPRNKWLTVMFQAPARKCFWELLWKRRFSFNQWAVWLCQLSGIGHRWRWWWWWRANIY